MKLNKDKRIEDMIPSQDMSNDQLIAEIQYMHSHLENTLIEAVHCARDELSKRFKKAFELEILIYFENLINKGIEWPEAEFQTREKFQIHKNSDWEDLTILYDSNFMEEISKRSNNQKGGDNNGSFL